MSWLFSFFKQMFCRHEWRFHRNVYGDEIMHRSFNRSEWCCSKCGRWTFRAELHNEEKPDWRKEYQRWLEIECERLNSKEGSVVDESSLPAWYVPPKDGYKRVFVYSEITGEVHVIYVANRKTRDA
jgi:hypothetical protein